MRDEFLAKLGRLLELDQRLRSGATHRELAEALGVSDRTIRNDLNTLKLLGAPILSNRFGTRYHRDWSLDTFTLKDIYHLLYFCNDNQFSHLALSSESTDDSEEKQSC